MELSRYIINELKKKGANDVVISLSKTYTKQVRFSNNEINLNLSYNFESLNIFASLNQRIINTSLRELSKKAADLTIKKILINAKNLPKNEDYKGIANGKFNYPKIEDNYDKEIDNVNPVDIVEEAISLSVNNGALKCAGVLFATKSEDKLFTSNSITEEDKKTHYYFSIRSMNSKDASGHSNAVSSILSKLNYRNSAKESAEISKMSLNPKESPDGKFDVIFSPLAFAPLLKHTGDSASVYSIESGFSFLPKKLGEKVANTNVTLIDDGTYKNGSGTSKYDDEGHPRQRTTVVENGILKSFLHNTSTAIRYKTKSTGNAGLISPDPTNFILMPGDFTKDKMIENVKNGILITNIWYTRFNNYLTGEFSTIPRDGTFLIKNGKILYPINRLRVSDSLQRIYKNIIGLGKELKPIESWEAESPTILPYVLVKDVNITKPK